MPDERTVKTRYRARWIALITALLLTTSSCGADARSDEAAVDDVMDVVEDTTPAPDTTPVVEPPTPSPAFVLLDASPKRIIYATDAEVTLTATVYDQFGEPMPDAQLEWTALPEGSASQTEESSGLEARWALIEEAAIQIEACTLASNTRGEPVCATGSFLVDVSPPTLEILSPEPGATLTGEEETIEVIGVARDTHGDISVYVNGELVALEADGRFTTTIEAHFGVNHLEVIAADNIQRVATSSALDVMWAAEYLTLDDRREVTGLTLDEGMRLYATQGMMDDGAPLEAAPVGELTEVDVADLLTLVLANLDLRGLIPDPVIDESAITLRVNDARVGSPQVDVTLIEDGVELFIQLPSITATTEGALDLDGSGQPLDLGGTLQASASALALLRVRKLDAESPHEVEVLALELAIESLGGDFNEPAVEALVALADSALRDTLEGLLVGALNDAFLDALPTLLSDALNSIDGLFAGQSFNIETGFLPTLEINLSGGLTSIHATPNTALSAIVRVGLETTNAPRFLENPGVPRLAESGEPFLPGIGGLQLGVPLALLNGLLHTLWDSGLLELDLGAILPPEVSSLVQSGSLSGKLTPVVVPATRGGEYPLFLELGQAELTLVYARQTDQIGVNLRIGLDLTLEDNALKLTLAPSPEILAWLISTTEASGRAFLTPTNIEGLLHEILWPEIEAALGDGLNLELPNLPLDALAEYAPALGELSLTLSRRSPLKVRGRHLIIEAGLFMPIDPALVPEHAP